MKNIYIYLSLLAVIVLGTACNNEWEDEQYEQYVSFKAPIASGSDGVTTIYVRYKDNGKVTYQLPIIVSGSTVNSQDRDIHIAVDKDTLKTLNIERFSLIVRNYGIRKWRKTNMNFQKQYIFLPVRA